MHHAAWASGAVALTMWVAACGVDGAGPTGLGPPPSTSSPPAVADCQPAADDATDPTQPATTVVPAPSTVAPPTNPPPPVVDAAYAEMPVWPDGPPVPRAADGTWTVLYLGDSMAETTVCLLADALPDWRVLDVTYGGTAPCDWVDHPAFLDALRAEPDLVVFSFLGNSITPCTEHAVGSALLDAYVRDVHTLCDAASPARCVAVGQPALAPTIERTLPGPDEPNATFFAHAFAGDWGFVDAGHGAEAVTGEFDALLRGSDGVHFNEAGAAATATRIADYLQRSVDGATDAIDDLLG